jgi:hypothetical protein
MQADSIECNWQQRSRQGYLTKIAARPRDEDTWKTCNNERQVGRCNSIGGLGEMLFVDRKSIALGVSARATDGWLAPRRPLALARSRSQRVSALAQDERAEAGREMRESGRTSSTAASSWARLPAYLSWRRCEWEVFHSNLSVCLDYRMHPWRSLRT